MGPGSSSTRGFAEVNGARLQYEVAGEGDPVVLIHAGICDSRMWDDQWAAFARHFRVIRYDVRGFGQSPAPSMTYAHRDDLYALLGDLGVEQAHLVAVSMAGRIALEFTLEHPEMARSLVLVASSVGAVAPSEALQQAWEQADLAFTGGDIAGANEIELQAWVDGPGRGPDHVDPVVRERVREMNANNFALLNDAAVDQPLDPPVRDRLSELRVPVLVIVGDHDQPHVVASADHFVDAIADARKVVMPGTAHLPSMERPDEFNRLVLDFLRGQTGPS
jgi:3-oxoadipate enol-lactonase